MCMYLSTTAAAQQGWLHIHGTRALCLLACEANREAGHPCNVPLQHGASDVRHRLDWSHLDGFSPVGHLLLLGNGMAGIQVADDTSVCGAALMHLPGSQHNRWVEACLLQPQGQSQPTEPPCRRPPRPSCSCSCICSTTSAEPCSSSSSRRRSLLCAASKGAASCCTCSCMGECCAVCELDRALKDEVDVCHLLPLAQD